MVKNNYIPAKGDIVWLNFDPQAGHEQKGKRPALILSPVEYNKKTGLVIFCPITNQIKGYPFEVNIGSKKISGVVLSDQMKSLDWKIRDAEFILTVSKSVMDDVMHKVKLLIF